MFVKLTLMISATLLEITACPARINFDHVRSYRAADKGSAAKTTIVMVDGTHNHAMEDVDYIDRMVEMRS